MNQAIADIIEVCSTARAQAILQGKEFNVEFHPRAGTLQVVAGKSIGPARVNTGPSMPSPAPAVPSSSPSSSPSGFSAKLSDRILIELLDINKLPHDFREDESAWVRFFPDGTCDELTLILLSDRNERREITLEVTTGLASVEADPRRFR
jgi:hypothetical protein